ncbi:MAG: toll/interleukin-1 receptor domain-containing protein, partial [Nitrospirota bacterium]|nr:toll/interleukin-1 receptor domain-containing protein [Nitrospirota bacterium]
IGGRDYPPRRSPGCSKGPHVSDPDLLLNPELAGELESLKERLRELEARESTNSVEGRVFISYCHADESFVNDLTCRLANDKVPHWRDEKDLLVGEVVDAAISRGIQASALFLIVLSRSSLNSGWVNRELDEATHEATEGRKIILPVLVAGLAVKELPPRIRRFKCADFNLPFDQAYSLLLKSISAHLTRE